MHKMAALLAAFAGLLFVPASAYSSSRKPIVSGNWKLNPATLGDAAALADSLTTLEDREVIVFPPAPFLSAVADAAAPGVHLGAQDAYAAADAGAFTGAVSFPMLASLPRVSFILARSGVITLGLPRRASRAAGTNP